MPSAWGCSGVPHSTHQPHHRRRSLLRLGHRVCKQKYEDTCRVKSRTLNCSFSRAQGLVAQAVAAEPEVMQTVQVALGDRSYPIYIGQGLLDRSDLLQQHILGKKVLIVTNETVAPLYLDRCINALSSGGRHEIQVVTLPDGEQFKSLEVLQQVWDKALQSRLDRNSTFVALGGGVIGDMCGFAASAYQRGVHFIQVPTTVMATVDSSVGGKTGVNHPLGKNMIGAFYQPQCVLIDTDTLITLPDRELASGISEIVKYGLIRDAPLFEWLEQNMHRLMQRDPEAWTYAIEQSCLNKAAVVAADEREGGVRATLNLGHTFGHAIETGLGYGVWLHGEAVAAGMVMAADMSHRLGWIDQSILDRTRHLLQRAKLPVEAPQGMTQHKFRDLMAVDKKVLDGALRLILLKGSLGSCVFTADFDAQALDQTLTSFCEA
ncbi:TPA: hypothetical protein ACH3X2_013702 [Trebouxia sp. C0005]|nr:MAG: 3-dehydroquinate synthase [Trebouxia sp. A1-2]